MERLYALATTDTVKNALIFFIAIGSLFALAHAIGDDELRSFVEDAGPWGWFVLILAKASTMIFAPLSGSLLYPLAGSLYGFWTGWLLVIIGDFIGGTVTFWIGRLWGRTLTERFLGNDVAFLNKALELTGSVKGFLIARIMMISLPELATYAAGLTRISYLPFAAIHVIVGLFPSGILTATGSYIIEGNFWGTGITLGIMSLLGAAATVTFMRFSGVDLFDSVTEKKTDQRAT
jgi:uncharacterized membrane protein YdjX (TVP38/TMEM64 family)